MSIDPEHEIPPRDPTRADGTEGEPKATPPETRAGENPIGKIKAGAIFRKYRPKPVAAEEEPPIPPPVAPPAVARVVTTTGVASAEASPPRPPEAVPAARTFGAIFKGGRSAPPAAPSGEIASPSLPVVPEAAEGISTEPALPVPESEPDAVALSTVSAGPAASTTPGVDAVARVDDPEQLANAPSPAPARLEPSPVTPSESGTAPAPAVESAPTSVTSSAVAATASGAEPTQLSESPFLAAHRILVAARQDAAASENRGDRPMDPPSDDANNPASEALMYGSSKPSLIRAAATIFKRSAIWMVLLGFGYYGTSKWLIPLVQELRNPGKTDAIHDKAAPLAVRVVQQTRQVVVKNDARVDELNSIIVDSAGAKAPPATPPPPPPPKAAPVVVQVVAAPDRGMYQAGVDRLKIAGVFSGDDPRINIDGRLFKYGDIVDRSLGLRFIGIDPSEHVLLFSNMDSVTFKKSY